MSMKNVLYITTLILLAATLQGCFNTSFTANDQGILAERMKCKELENDIWQKEAGGYVHEVFYSPELQSCLYVTQSFPPKEHADEADYYSSWYLRDYFSGDILAQWSNMKDSKKQPDSEYLQSEEEFLKIVEEYKSL